MPIRIKPNYETFNDLHVISLNKIEMYCIAIGAIRELSVEDQEYLPQGEVYLYQELVENDPAYENRMHELYDKLIATGEDIPTYDDLADFDGLISLKAKYHMGKGEHEDVTILIDEVICIPPDDQLTFDDNGNIVRASIFDDE